MTQRNWRERADSRNYWLLVGAGVLVLSAQVAIGVAVFFPSSKGFDAAGHFRQHQTDASAKANASVFPN
jgi:hypothetical protein